jgi:ABC-type transport system substrate-binding protein
MKHNKLYILVAVIVLSSMILAACATTPTPTVVVTEAPATSAPVATTPPAAVPPTAVPPTAAPAYEGISLSAPDCTYGGEFLSIEAVDAKTVKFTLCFPDPAFLAKIAFSAFAIHSSDQIMAMNGDSTDMLENPIGTGPYMLGEWKHGDELVLTRNDNYWGEPAANKTVVFRWSAEAAQRFLELQAGTVDGIDNVGPDDFAVAKSDPNLQLIPREPITTFYVGMNNTFKPFDDEKVRQAIAMGIDKQRIVDNFYPPGSTVADYFCPCSLPNGCVGDPFYKFDAVAAKALLAEAGFPNGFDTTITYRDVVRGYLPQPGVVAQDLQAQLKANLNINAKLEVMESGAFLKATSAGEVGGLHLLGWGADFPDVVNFLDYHFGVGATDQFGTKWTDITDALTKGAQLADNAAREPYYVTANNALRQHVPMVPIAHGGSGVAYKATVKGAHASPLGNEDFAVMSIPGQDTFVWMQNAEPLSLYCADETDGETLRACEQINESLYRYEVAGTAAIPNLATSCDPNTELTEWTCHLREGVTFSDGSTLDANDVTLSLIAQWDYSSPYHIARTSVFEYFGGLWAGMLNVPPPEPTPTATP